MNSVTPLGWRWEVRHSFWMIFALTPFTLSISFFYVGVRIRKMKWILSGYFYFLLLNGLIYVLWKYMLWDDDFSGFAFPILFIGYFRGIVVLTQSARKDYLRKLYVVISAEERERLLAIEQVRRKKREKRAAPKNKLTRVEIKKRQSQQAKFVRSESELNQIATVININQASIKDVEQLPGIGHILAQKIINTRNKVNEFSSFDDLVIKTRIQVHLLAKAKDYITFSDKEIPKKKEKLTEKMQALDNQDSLSGRSIDL